MSIFTFSPTIYHLLEQHNFFYIEICFFTILNYILPAFPPLLSNRCIIFFMGGEYVYLQSFILNSMGFVDREKDGL